jgi:hypothetical protein
VTDDVKPLLFRLLQGGSALSSSKREVELQVVPHRAPAQVQLGFPFVHASNRLLVSVGYDGLTQHFLHELLRRYMPSSIVDIRVSPSFNSHLLTRQAVSESLQAFHVKYFHFLELANRFVGDSLDLRWSLERYGASLTRHSSSLVRVHELIEQGPVILLSRPSDHLRSERAVLVDELKRRWPTFEVVVHS